MDVIVVGNVTLDVICQTVDDVPRFESISFDRVIVSPGGCGSNVAVGLSMLGIQTALVCRVGEDQASELLRNFWQKCGIDLSYLKILREQTTAVSVGLVDSNAQPRFIHTPGANRFLKAEDIDVTSFINGRIKLLHIAGFFVLPGLLDNALPQKLKLLRKESIITCLDVVYSPRYWKPEYLWKCLPEIDYFLCNNKEASKLTDEENPSEAAKKLLKKGANTILIKLGSEGCLVCTSQTCDIVPAPVTEVVDTTGAGDAFAAGFISKIIKNTNLFKAVSEGNRVGANMVTKQGAIGAWF